MNVQYSFFAPKVRKIKSKLDKLTTTVTYLARVNQNRPGKWIMADAQNKPSIPTTEKILLNILKKIQIQSAFSSS